ncbi:MAG: ATP synthase F0 subunit A, partial [Verrucomicrobiota bacterium]
MPFLSQVLSAAPSGLLAASEGVKPNATDLFQIGGYWISNSILTTWIVAALIILVIRIAVGTPKLIPGKGQAVVEGLAQG